MITPETKFNCQVNICIWCKSQASVDALKVMFSGTSDFKLRYVRIHQGNDNTVITFPIFHDTSMPEQGLFSCAVEGSIPNFPGLRDVVAFAYEFTSLCKDLMGHGGRVHGSGVEIVRRVQSHAGQHPAALGAPDGLARY